MRGVSRQSLEAVHARVRELTADSSGKKLRPLADEVFAVVHLLTEQPRLRRIVSDPGVGADQRAGLIRDLLGDRLSAEAADIVDVLVRSPWSRPADIVDAADDVAAEVLFAAEDQDGKLDDVEDELFRFGRILEREPRLRSALTDPSLPTDRKEALLDALLDGKVRAATTVLVREVVLHPRGRTVDRGLEEYSRQAAARRERLIARVRTVLPLTDKQLKRLADGLAAELGHSVHLNVEIDPDLVGGLTVRVGDELYDASIAHRITTVRRLMTG
jgi:F-type H+-transporting ATPase subunit delta